MTERDYLRGLPAADRMSELVATIVEQDAEVIACMNGMISLVELLSKRLSQSKRIAVVNRLRDASDVIERPMLQVDDVRSTRR